MAKKKAFYEDLKQTMLDDLTARGLVEPVYLDKVEEYITLYKHREAAAMDVEKRGLIIVDPETGRTSENPCSRAERDYGRCMLNIYKALGFQDNSKAPRAKAGDEDDEL